MHVSDVLNDLVAEQSALDDIAAGLAPDAWALATASPRWSVADQIGHLAYFDATAAMAISDEAAFLTHRDAMLSALTDDPVDGDESTLGEFRAMTPEQLLAAWRTNRRSLADAAATLDDDTRVQWYGPSMGSKSFLTARLMECWAHGQDICDVVGAERPATDRLRHVAQIGFITRGWSYVNRGREVPDSAVRVELAAPSGDTWQWGDDDADQSIVGDATDFCLVVTQRRHVDDTGLTVTGADAREWMEIGQAYAGAASDGPAPRA